MRKDFRAIGPDPFAFHGCALPLFWPHIGVLQGVEYTFSSATDRALLWHSEVTTMATLQSINNVFHIRFRFDGHPYRRSLGIVVRDDAEDTRKQVEVNSAPHQGGANPAATVRSRTWHSMS